MELVEPHGSGPRAGPASAQLGLDVGGPTFSLSQQTYLHPWPLAAIFTMTFSQEAASWFSPSPVELSPTPQPGQQAPSCAQLPFPAHNGRPTIVTFLRHCGCPGEWHSKSPIPPMRSPKLTLDLSCGSNVPRSARCCGEVPRDQLCRSIAQRPALDGQMAGISGWCWGSRS